MNSVHSIVYEKIVYDVRVAINALDDEVWDTVYIPSPYMVTEEILIAFRALRAIQSVVRIHLDDLLLKTK